MPDISLLNPFREKPEKCRDARTLINGIRLLEPTADTQSSKTGDAPEGLPERKGYQMVRIQKSEACPDKMLVGSDLPDSRAAWRELEVWVEQNGYCLSRNARHLSVFEQGTLVREWVVVERAAQRRPFPFNLFATRVRSGVASTAAPVSLKQAA